MPFPQAPSQKSLYKPVGYLCIRGPRSLAKAALRRSRQAPLCCCCWAAMPGAALALAGLALALASATLAFAGTGCVSWPHGQRRLAGAALGGGATGLHPYVLAALRQHKELADSRGKRSHWRTARSAAADLQSNVLHNALLILPPTLDCMHKPLEHVVWLGGQLG